MGNGKTWKVYCYTNKVNGKKYVGITSTSLPARSGHRGKKYRECPFFGNAIAKYGWDAFEVEILRNNLSETEAAELEQFYIKALHTQDSRFGYNIRSGGYENHEFSPDGRERHRIAHSGANSVRSIRTSVYDLSGRLVKTFDTGAEAAEFLGVSDVSEACKSRRGTLANHIVRYESDFGGAEQLPDSAIYKRYDYRLLYKPVNQYDLNGHFIKRFNSILDAAAEASPSGRGKSCISGCVSGKYRTAYGYIWRSAVDHDCSDITPPDQYKPKSGSELPHSVGVRQLTLDGALIAEYSSIKEAHMASGASCNAIYMQLSGRTKRPLKFRWERIE